jgi:hypothetical protein
MPINPYKLAASNLYTGDLASNLYTGNLTCIYVFPQNLIASKHTNLYIMTSASSSYTAVCFAHRFHTYTADGKTLESIA